MWPYPIHTRVHMYTHTHSHTCPHTHTCTHTHAPHTHTCTHHYLHTARFTLAALSASFHLKKVEWARCSPTRLSHRCLCLSLQVVRAGANTTCVFWNFSSPTTSSGRWALQIFFICYCTVHWIWCVHVHAHACQWNLSNLVICGPPYLVR